MRSGVFPVATTEKETEGTIERENWMTDEEMEKRRAVEESPKRNGDHAGTLEVVQNRGVHQGEKVEVISVSTAQDEKGGVTCGLQEEEVRSLVPERALFSGVC